MPIDERWDKLSDEAWSNFASEWVRQLRVGVKEGERDYGSSVTMLGFTARPEQLWKFLIAAIHFAQTDDELGHIAAGPIEYFLGKHGDKYIVEVERQAAAAPKFARALTGAWKYIMSDEVWARVRAIQEKTPSLQMSDDKPISE